MDRRRSKRDFGRGFACGALAVVAAGSANWLITPMSHPDASDLQQMVVVAQVVVGLVVAGWIYFAWRRSPSTRR